MSELKVRDEGGLKGDRKQGRREEVWRGDIRRIDER